MSFEEEMAAALGTLVLEARELLGDMESALLEMEQGHAPEEALGAVFRAAHTIKGSAGLFGLEHVVAFTHGVETLLDQVRAGDVPVSGELVGLLLPCRDHIAMLIDAVAQGRLAPQEEQEAAGEWLLQRLAGLSSAVATAGTAGGERAVEPAAQGGNPLRPVHVSMRFGRDCLRGGMDPLAFLRYLSSLAEVVDVHTVSDALPDADDADVESCYLGFEVALLSDAPLADLESVFDFVRDESDIRVLEPGAAGAQEGFAALQASYGHAADAVRAFLERTGAVRAGVAVLAPQAPAVSLVPEPRTPSPSPSSLSSPLSTPDERPAAPFARGGEPANAQAKPGEARTIRIDASRLDHLIDVVGELVIAGAAAGLRARGVGDDTLSEALGDVMRLVEEVRDGALQLRMVPVGTTFGRFQRVVRDVAAELGKEIDLVVTGGDTEVDKALVERIGDPLLHLVRNAMDHGIEPAEVRAERGKPARGTLRLNAFHESGSIVIEVADDGGGIDRDRVLATAIERGLVEHGASLSDAEVYSLIFEPGFSTAKQVSSLSGRGVGMDVVKRNVTALRGGIEVDSEVGAGTTVRIRLPLTLAIIDGFLVGVGRASFVVPLDYVVECVELPNLPEHRECMDLRGQVLPCVRVSSLFDLGGSGGEASRRESVVVVEYAGMRTGLIVDTLGGEFQTVIKPLGPLFEHVRGIGGATILGDGSVALIVDVPLLVRHHTDRQAAGQMGVFLA